MTAIIPNSCNCMVTPSIGTAMNTNYNFNCTGCTISNPNYTLSYNYINPNTNIKYWETSKNTSLFSTQFTTNENNIFAVIESSGGGHICSTVAFTVNQGFCFVCLCFVIRGIVIACFFFRVFCVLCFF